MFNDIISALESLSSMKDGVYLIGWALSAFMLWRHFTNRDTYVKDVDAIRIKSEETIARIKSNADDKVEMVQAQAESKLNHLKDSYIEEMKNMHDSLQDLHTKNAKLFIDISDKRVEDIKEVTEEYNKMAEAILVTLDKLAASISKSRE